jgi:hypothetical protein
MEANAFAEEDKEKGVDKLKGLGMEDKKEAKEPGAAGGERRWIWAFPLIEGVPPCPRGGHTATLAGQSLIIFGGHYYSGKELGYAYLNDVHVLDVNQNRWLVTVPSAPPIEAETRRRPSQPSLQAQRGTSRPLHHHLRRPRRTRQSLPRPSRPRSRQNALAPRSRGRWSAKCEIRAHSEPSGREQDVRVRRQQRQRVLQRPVHPRPREQRLDQGRHDR